jgi:fructose-specific phosphotransferase system IIC component
MDSRRGLSAGSPKNLMLGAAAGAALSQIELTIAQHVVAMLIFVGIASSSVVAPVIYYLRNLNRAAEEMEALRRWLTRHNASIMVLILLILGAILIANGGGGIVAA